MNIGTVIVRLRSMKVGGARVIHDVVVIRVSLAGWRCGCDDGVDPTRDMVLDDESAVNFILAANGEPTVKLPTPFIGG